MPVTTFNAWYLLQALLASWSPDIYFLWSGCCHHWFFKIVLVTYVLTEITRPTHNVTHGEYRDVQAHASMFVHKDAYSSVSGPLSKISPERHIFYGYLVCEMSRKFSRRSHSLSFQRIVLSAQCHQLCHQFRAWRWFWAYIWLIPAAARINLYPMLHTSIVGRIAEC